MPIAVVVNRCSSGSGGGSCSVSGSGSGSYCKTSGVSLVNGDGSRVVVVVVVVVAVLLVVVPPKYRVEPPKWELLGLAAWS